MPMSYVSSLSQALPDLARWALTTLRGHVFGRGPFALDRWIFWQLSVAATSNLKFCLLTVHSIRSLPFPKKAGQLQHTCAGELPDFVAQGIKVQLHHVEPGVRRRC